MPVADQSVRFVGRMAAIPGCIDEDNILLGDPTGSQLTDDVEPWTKEELKIQHVAVVVGLHQPSPIAFPYKQQDGVIAELVPLKLTHPDVNGSMFERLSMQGQLQMLQQDAWTQSGRPLTMRDLLDYGTSEKPRARLFIAVRHLCFLQLKESNFDAEMFVPRPQGEDPITKAEIHQFLDPNSTDDEKKEDGDHFEPPPRRVKSQAEQPSVMRQVLTRIEQLRAEDGNTIVPLMLSCLRDAGYAMESYQNRVRGHPRKTRRSAALAQMLWRACIAMGEQAWSTLAGRIRKRIRSKGAVPLKPKETLRMKTHGEFIRWIAHSFLAQRGLLWGRRVRRGEKNLEDYVGYIISEPINDLRLLMAMFNHQVSKQARVNAKRLSTMPVIVQFLKSERNDECHVLFRGPDIEGTAEEPRAVLDDDGRPVGNSTAFVADWQDPHRPPHFGRMGAAVRARFHMAETADMYFAHVQSEYDVTLDLIPPDADPAKWLARDVRCEVDTQGMSKSRSYKRSRRAKQRKKQQKKARRAKKTPKKKNKNKPSDGDAR